ncbi:MAG TPA: gas vesicle protein [Amycolatopsis sp.]|uniref:Gas vesicle protein n=1 Tax=Amycolatopsis nalaikhensis TaxID=715472 RepID=A0ABY8Y0P5_9PSEU|nr:gas vesicle protein [Amycolatopsis sp. 2-2]WIV61366.1 gas vesicle protein [Amycolatopsis sp. 2-2]
MSQPVPAPVAAERPVALIDLLDRVLAGGVVVSGELTLSIADVDLVHISLRTLLTSITALQPRNE